MSNKHFLLFLVTLSFMIGASACVKPASQAPKNVEEITPTLAIEPTFPLPGTSDDVMSQLEAFATQTAIAIMGPVTTAEEPGLTGEITPGEPLDTPSSEAPVEATVEPTDKATSAPVVVPTATPGIPKTYTLKKGEHPYCIARRFNVDPNEMLRLSGLSGGSVFSSGTVLKIPQSGSKFPGKRALKSHPTTYTVVSGDTVNSIACLFGDVDPDAILYANNLKSVNDISPGDSLKIP
jgi:LysM repeat protein